MRLIDADPLIKFCTYCADDVVVKIDRNTMAKMLAHAPEIDAEPVVQCKDCKYMTEHYDTDGNAPYWTCSEWDAGTDYDGFCHYGERKDDE